MPESQCGACCNTSAVEFYVVNNEHSGKAPAVGDISKLALDSIQTAIFV